MLKILFRGWTTQLQLWSTGSTKMMIWRNKNLVSWEIWNGSIELWLRTIYQNFTTPLKILFTKTDSIPTAFTVSTTSWIIPRTELSSMSNMKEETFSTKYSWSGLDVFSPNASCHRCYQPSFRPNLKDSSSSTNFCQTEPRD